MFITARLVIEDAVLYLMAFYLVSSVIFAAGGGVFNTYLPGQRWNSSTNSLEPWDTTPDTFMWGNPTEFNNTMGQYYNITDKANPGAMLDPTAVMNLIGFYIGFLYSMVSSTMLYHVLLPFIGVSWAHALTFVLNLMIVIVSLRVISGRLRWD